MKFPRQARLLSAGEFRAVFRSGRRAQAGPLRARLKDNGLDHGRLGMAIARKNARNAVIRNRFRRQIRESYRRHQGELAGLDIVVSVYPSGDPRGVSLWPRLPRLWSAVASTRKAGDSWKN